MPPKKKNYDVKDLKLAEAGQRKIEWAAREMPVIKIIRDRFAKEKPLTGIRISACLHITSETANLALALKAGGADLILCASNPLSTQDEVAAALVSYGIPTNAIKGEDQATYYKHINTVLDHKPQITIDDGADIVTALHTTRQDAIKKIIGGTEETTAGVTRERNMEMEGKLRYPIIAVNDAQTKHFFDNRYGTGQSTLDGIIRATNILFAGKNVVVCGYGWCGKGIAMRAKGLGVNCYCHGSRARTRPRGGHGRFPCHASSGGSPARRHLHHGHRGQECHRQAHLKVMKDGAIMANSGHFNVEINIPALESLSIEQRTIRPFVQEYTVADGKRHLYLLGEGETDQPGRGRGTPGQRDGHELRQPGALRGIYGEEPK